MIQRTDMLDRANRLQSKLANLTSAYDVPFEMWHASVCEFIEEAFGENNWRNGVFQNINWKWSPISRRGVSYNSQQILENRIQQFSKAKQGALDFFEEVSESLASTSVATQVFHSKGTPQENNRIFITHGRNGEWKDVQRFIENELDISTLELAQTPSSGRTIIEKLEEESEKCNYAVIVMSADDLDSEGVTRVRENVMHEIGFFQAKYGRDKVCLLHCEGVTIPTNIAGIVYLPYPSSFIRATFVDLREEIKQALKF